MSAKYAAGDRLILRRLNSTRSADIEVVVYKVGRKWGYAKPDGGSFPDVKFDLETGYEDGRGYSSTCRVLTAEQDAIEARVSAVTLRLKELGVRIESYTVRRLSVEALERVAVLIREGVES